MGRRVRRTATPRSSTSRREFPRVGFTNLDASGYGGSFDGIGPVAQGQSARRATNKALRDCSSPDHARCHDMRLEPVLIDPHDRGDQHFHNTARIYSGFGEAPIHPGTHDLIDARRSTSRRRTSRSRSTPRAVRSQNDHQNDVNNFAHFTWHHQFGEPDSAKGPGATLFGALFYRHRRLTYIPTQTTTPRFVSTRTPRSYNLSENRTSNSTARNSDYALIGRTRPRVQDRALSSVTYRPREVLDHRCDRSARARSRMSDLDGSDFGIYGQAAYSPVGSLRDPPPACDTTQHHAPFLGTVSQVSPRIRLNFFPYALNSFWLYYGRLFMPTNIEDLRAITSVADRAAWRITDAARARRFLRGRRHPASRPASSPSSPATTSAAIPGIDDNTVPGSAIVTDVNLADVRITGIEGVLEVEAPGSVLGLHQLRAESRLRLRHNHGRFLPDRTAERQLRSRSRSAGVDRGGAARTRRSSCS